MFANKLFERRNTDDTNSFDWSKFILNTGIGSTSSKKEETYSECLKILGDTVGKLALEVKQDTEKGEKQLKNHDLYEKLRLRPNESMSAFDTYASLIRLLKHYGQAGLYISRSTYSGKVLGLYPVKIDGFIIDNKGIINSSKDNKVVVDFSLLNECGSCFEKDIIILRDNSLDGIHGEPMKNSVKSTMQSNIKANNYQLDLFSNGLTNKAVVQLTSDIKDEKDLKKIQTKFNRIYSNQGRIFTVPAGFNVSSLNLNLADSQFAELKVLGKKGISSALGVPFSFVDDLKYISDEDIMTFISLTIHPILSALEQELDWKLLTQKERNTNIKIRFNVNGLLRMTPKRQQEILCEYVKQGIYSLNYAKGLLGVPLLDKDVTVFPSGQVTLEQLIEGKVSYVKDNLKGGE